MTINYSGFVLFVTSVATALTACGIETDGGKGIREIMHMVATALTACGIETHMRPSSKDKNSDASLQQRLPLAVLKL